MKKLYEPFRNGVLDLSNRMVMAPLTRNRSPGEVANDLNRLYYVQRASAGLIISEATPISEEGRGYIHVPGLFTPEQLEAWRKVTNGVHEKGSKIFAQLWHVGRVSHSSLQPGGGAPVAPSALCAKARTFIKDENGVGTFAETSEPRALGIDELPRIVTDYARAAKNAVNEAGFDGVEIHAANGYLLDQFLRADSNHRSDAYGGSIENRIRLTLEVVEAIIGEIGGARTGIRISPVSPANDAHDLDPQPLFDALIKALARYDLAYIHVIEGATGGDRDYQEADYPFDYDRLKQAYRNAGGKGAWMVNNGYTREMAEQAVESSHADLVAFGRAYIYNPDLVERFKAKAPLNEPRQTLNNGGGAEGYTDYPLLG